MLENRPIVSITVGYMLGIIMGLYCKISIVFLYLVILIIYPRTTKKSKFKLVSIKRYSRYLKIILTKKVLIMIVISSIISNSIVLYQNYKYENLYSKFNQKEVFIRAKIVSNVKEKDYKDVYKIKVNELNKSNKYKNTYLYLNIKKSQNLKLEYGQEVYINGKYIEPEGQRNYKGFDYKEYLKTLKIYGTIESSNVKVSTNYGTNKSIFIYSNLIFLKIKDIIQKNFEPNVANIILGILLGYTDEIDGEVKQDFIESNITHILAVSGAHIGYLILFTKIILEGLLGKRKTYQFMIVILGIYSFITGFAPSVVRAVIMNIFAIIASIVYRKSDIWQNMSLAMLVLLVYNPFLIENIGVWLTFLGTIGIVSRVYKKSITISATLTIIPAIVICFNKIYITSLLISMIVGGIVGIIFIGSFIFLVFYQVLDVVGLKQLVIQIVSDVVSFVIKLSDIGSKLPYNSVYVVTPNILLIIFYYVILFIRSICKFNL